MLRLVKIVLESDFFSLRMSIHIFSSKTLTQAAKLCGQGTPKEMGPEGVTRAQRVKCACACKSESTGLLILVDTSDLLANTCLM